MSNQSTLLALADRCEKADGPDRELDYAILIALGYSWRRMAWGGDDKDIWKGSSLFTASLDAAVTLVPEGWGWAVSTTGAGLPCAYGHPPGNGLAVAWIDDTPAATPALAMCAFALRARTGMEVKQ
jgi:hypothetical protein